MSEITETEAVKDPKTEFKRKLRNKNKAERQKLKQAEPQISASISERPRKLRRKMERETAKLERLTTKTPKELQELTEQRNKFEQSKAEARAARQTNRKEKDRVSAMDSDKKLGKLNRMSFAKRKKLANRLGLAIDKVLTKDGLTKELLSINKKL